MGGSRVVHIIQVSDFMVYTVHAFSFIITPVPILYYIPSFPTVALNSQQLFSYGWSFMSPSFIHTGISAVLILHRFCASSHRFYESMHASTLSYPTILPLWISTPSGSVKGFPLFHDDLWGHGVVQSWTLESILFSIYWLLNDYTICRGIVCGDSIQLGASYCFFSFLQKCLFI